MSAARMLPKVRELEVQREEDTPLVTRRTTDLGVGAPQEPLLQDRLDIEARLREVTLQVAREVLVELQLQAGWIFHRFSRARSAA
jgi:hypothetical protein